MGGHKTISGSDYPIPTYTIADYHVRDDITLPTVPSIVGNYFKRGTYGGKFYLAREDYQWFIWWNTNSDNWFCTQTLGVVTEFFFVGTTEGIITTLEGHASATGEADVLEGPA